MSGITIEVREKSTQPFDVVVTDAAGTAVTPTTCSFKILNRDGDVLSGPTAVTPSTSMRITLAGTQLALESQASYREYRVLAVATDQGDVAKPENLEVEFWIKNLLATT